MQLRKYYQKTKKGIHLVTKHVHLITIKMELLIKNNLKQKLFNYILRQEKFYQTKLPIDGADLNTFSKCKTIANFE